MEASSVARPGYGFGCFWDGSQVRRPHNHRTGRLLHDRQRPFFIQNAASPYSLGGLIGSLFFAGYMLTQFPGGYLGDKFRHRTIIVISIMWADMATLLGRLATGLLAFVYCQASNPCSSVRQGCWSS